MMYDILIVGGGPAGLSAAVNAAARGKRCAVLSNDYRMNPLFRSEKIDNYLGMRGLSGEQMLRAMRREAEEAQKARSKKILYTVIGIVCAVIVFVVLVGGIQRIGDVCALLVPVMAIIYVLASLCVIIFNITAIPHAFAAIFKGAFAPASVAGGLAGVGIRKAITKGVGRGIFSNEAGLGSAPIAHAAADVEDPVSQGIYGVFEVFMDTIVVCTMTAMVVLLGVGVDNIPYGVDQGAALTIAGFRSVFGGVLPGVIVALCLSLFALSTVLTWGLYGTRCFEFLFGNKAGKVYQVIFAIFVVVGATMELEIAWHIADTLNGLMALPNLVAVIALSPVVARLTKEHFAKAGRLGG